MRSRRHPVFAPRPSPSRVRYETQRFEFGIRAKDYGIHMSVSRRIFPCIEPRTNTIGGPYECDLIHELIGHGCDGFVAPTGKERVLNSRRRSLVAEALRIIVVEVFFARAHSADVQSQMLLDGKPSLFKVVVH